MRTERATLQSRCSATFLHVRGIRSGTVTASDRTGQRHAAPNLLPEWDTAPRAAACSESINSRDHPHQRRNLHSARQVEYWDAQDAHLGAADGDLGFGRAVLAR